MPKAQRGKYTGLFIPFFLAACLIAGYWFYWSRLADRIENRVRTALPNGVAQSVDVTGFPYRLTLELGGVKLSADNGLAFTSSKVIATATPFNPMLWVLENADVPTVALSGQAAQSVKATKLQASLRLSSGGFRRLSLTFDGLEAYGAKPWSLGRSEIHFEAAEADPNTFAASIDLNSLKLAKPLEGPGAILGQTTSRILMRGPISQGSALTRSLSDWALAGGKFTIMAGEIAWGPIGFSNAKGELSLSPSGKWQGSLRGTGALKPEGIAVSALSGPVDLTIVDNKLSLSGLPGVDLSDAFGGGR
jgi:hypothetical protein